MPAKPQNAPTLFFTAGSTFGMFVVRDGRRRRGQPMPFADAHAALAWCLANRAAFVCLPTPPVAGN
jgi:hypothetical protein